MAVDPRVAAMRAWAADLRLMTGVRPWGGSYVNAPTVELAFRTINQAPRYPHVCLLPFPGSMVKTATLDGTSYDDFYQAGVLGYVIGSPDVPVTEALDQLNRDCKITLLRSQPPGLLKDIVFGEESVSFYDNGLAEFELPFTAQLRDALA